MAAKDLAIGNTGNLALAAGDAFSTICDIEIFEWKMNATQERIESTTFTSSSIYRSWYMGTATVTVDIQGHYPSGVAFPTASVAAGRGLTSATAADTLTLTSTTGETVTVRGRINNPKIGVNRRTGLNSLTAKFIGRITGSATA